MINKKLVKIFSLVSLLTFTAHIPGLPWLCKHNPHLLWSENHIFVWAPSCNRQCLPNWAVPLQSTSIESPDADKDVTVLWEYRDLAEVFNSVKVTQAPPNWEWDCAITLKEAAVPPRSRICPISQEETHTME
ncbi:hypothetical protein P4O66_020221 [Electrophorus voltai]|uniref:Uncharacterized protein n=1 Tax=Electrophorus voltai TaxID=2609070 RepID=A0AAD9E6T5_9TELE|nr:hypothetical protein P4O66_020221 [Electrophorus voltai]